ncbi:UPF0496 protein At3g19330 isoform X2 [Carica papaya]|uniref:UPF0496 protein At3g19330 isoform X2 n=1 Tax=Carica papaya TaxID=3649 RepID=UPI000B8CE030|nr:UPF0496 protein At3g19330 isoform X2 [Carica papaya]
MLPCISFKSTSSTSAASPPSPATINLTLDPPPGSQGNSPEITPSSSTQPSPVLNLTPEYTLSFQTNSYNEMWSRIHAYDPDEHQSDQLEIHYEDGDQHRLKLSQVLQPNRQCVEEALRYAKHNTLTRLISSYFDHSENTTNLCLLLQHCVPRARHLYRPIDMLLDVLPHDLDSITQPQCNWAFRVFLEFDRLDNPFPCPGSQDFHEMRSCFSQLRQQLDRRLQKSKSRVRILGRATAGPLCSAYLPRAFKKKELAHISQLDAAAKGTYVLNNDLDTIDRLVNILYSEIEGDKGLIRLGLERGDDKYAIQEIVKRFRKSHVSFIHQLKDLEEHICLCFNTVNRARSLLLQEVSLHRSYSA